MIKNKLLLSFIAILASSRMVCAEENEFQKWTKNGSEYQSWTKDGQEFQKWTAGDGGYNASPYGNAYQEGYKEAHHEDKGIYSIEPIPPMAPIPKVGKTSEQDGFNRGFYEYYQERKEKWLKGE